MSVLVFPSSSFDERLGAHVASSEVILSELRFHHLSILGGAAGTNAFQSLFLRRLSSAGRVPCTPRTREFLACGFRQSMSKTSRLCLACGAFALADL